MMLPATTIVAVRSCSSRCSASRDSSPAALQRQFLMARRYLHLYHHQRSSVRAKTLNKIPRTVSPPPTTTTTTTGVRTHSSPPLLSFHTYRPARCIQLSTRSSSSSGSSDNGEKPGDKAAKEEPSSKTTSSSDAIIFDESSIEEIVELDQPTLQAAIDRTKFTQEIPVKMPDLGNSAGTSKVVKWYFAPGDVIQRGDVLCDIETPDFTFGMETDDEELGVLGEISVETGVPVPDNEVICILYHEAKAKRKVSKKKDIEGNEDTEVIEDKNGSTKKDREDKEDAVEVDDKNDIKTTVAKGKDDVVEEKEDKKKSQN